MREPSNLSGRYGHPRSTPSTRLLISYKGRIKRSSKIAKTVWLAGEYTVHFFAPFSTRRVNAPIASQRSVTFAVILPNCIVYRYSRSIKRNQGQSQATSNFDTDVSPGSVPNALPLVSVFTSVVLKT